MFSASRRRFASLLAAMPLLVSAKAVAAPSLNPDLPPKPDGTSGTELPRQCLLYLIDGVARPDGLREVIGTASIILGGGASEATDAAAIAQGGQDLLQKWMRIRR